MKYKIANNEQLNDFFNDARIAGHTCKAIKGDPPEEMEYSDGDLVEGQVNTGWINVVTGEQVDVVHAPYDS